MSTYGYSAFRFLALCVLAGSAFAQEVEPNNTCPGQHIGMPILPFSIAGSLDSPPDVPDVDFLRFDFTPGDELIADLEGGPTGAGTLSDALIGLFDSNCNLISFDDDGSGTLNSRLAFPVPGDGVVILAATSYADFSFEGNGFSGGSYTLKLAAAPPLIQSISGRLVDAQDGQPITGGEPTFAAVTLIRCDDAGCIEIASGIPDSQGRFTFGGALHGLRVGEYHLVASAVGYQEGQQEQSDPFQVAAGEQYTFGDFPLQPDELQIAHIRLCSAVPPEGRVCRYSFDLRNRGQSPFSGRVWSLVDYYIPNAGLSYAFQVGTGNAHTPQPTYVWVEPEQVKRVTFQVPIPPDWAALRGDGFACISAGIGRAPFAAHSVTAGVFIGCLARADDGVRLVSRREMSPEMQAATKASSLQGVRPKLRGHLPR